MPLRPDGPAPYGPPAAVLGVVHGFRDRGLATPITADVLMRAGVSESLVPRTLSSLEGLELIDENGMPTPALDGLRKATSQELASRMAEWLRGVYAEVFSFTDPAKDDAARITDAFRGFTPAGQRGRMVTLFLGLCEAAGIIPEGQRKPAPSSSGRPATKRAAPKRAGDSGRAEPRPGSFKHNLRADDGNILPEPILGLVRAIPLNGWTQARRDKFMDTFGHVLDFAIPVLEYEPTASRQDEAEE